jgi:hypothetical protein
MWPGGWTRRQPHYTNFITAGGAEQWLQGTATIVTEWTNRLPK